MKHSEYYNNLFRTFVIHDFWTGSTYECNGNQLRSMLIDMFPQAEGCTYRAIDEIADFNLSSGTNNPNYYQRIKGLESHLMISVSELI